MFVLVCCTNRQELTKEDLERVMEACDMVSKLCYLLDAYCTLVLTVV